MADVLVDDPGMFVIIEMMDQRDVDIISDLRYAMIGSDGIPVRGGEHPRLSGSFARALARRSHDQRQLAELISRMTSLPAETFRIPDRGLIAPGRIADLVVFDPASVRDQATYAEPTRHPLGITHVFLGGQAVVDDGRLTGERPGLVLEPTA